MISYCEVDQFKRKQGRQFNFRHNIKPFRKQVGFDTEFMFLFFYVNTFIRQLEI